MKRCSTSYVIRETQIKAERPYHTTTRKAETQKTDNTSAGAGVEQQERSFTAVGLQNGTAPLEGRLVMLIKLTHSYSLSNHNPWYMLKWTENRCIQKKNLHMNVYSNFTDNCPNLK